MLVNYGETHMLARAFSFLNRDLMIDVDTILIRSEKDDQKGNRIYNYRVPFVTFPN